MSSASSSSAAASSSSQPTTASRPRPSPTNRGYNVEWSLRRAKSNPAIELLEAALAEKTVPEDGLFTSALKECRYSGDAARALFFLQEMERLNMRMREIDFIATIAACAVQTRIDEAIEVFERMGKLEVRRGVNSYAAIITACSRGGQPERAMSFFRQMGGKGSAPSPNAACYAAMMETLRRHGKPNDALSLLDEMAEHRVPGSSLTLAAAIRAFSDAGKPKEALEIFQSAADMEADDAGCYAAAMEALAELEDWRQAVAMIDTMDDRGLRVGRQHYIAALRACAKTGEWGPALCLLDGMFRRGMRPDEKCHRWALVACSKGGQWQMALDILNRPGINWTLASYAAVMRALLQAGEADRGLALWEEITKKGLQPDASLGDMALSMAGKSKNWEMAESIYFSMKRWGLKPYIAGLGVVIEGRCQRGKVDEALALLRTLQSPNVILYTSVISALGRQGDVERALSIMREMEESHGILPDRVFLTAILDACVKAGALRDADIIAKRLGTVGAYSSSSEGDDPNTLDAKAFVVQLRALVEQGRWDDALAHLSEEEEVPWMAYSILIHAAGKQGRWEDALAILLRMHDESASRGDPHSLTSMDISSVMNACRLAGEWEICLQLLKIMRKMDGIGPNQMTYGLVLKALCLSSLQMK